MAISAEHRNSISFQSRHSFSIFVNEVLFIAYKIGKQDWKGRENINLLIETRHSHYSWNTLEFFDACISIENFGGSKFEGHMYVQNNLLIFLGLLYNLMISIFSITLYSL